jgi:BREX system ATP-binding protein BrxC/D
MKIKPREQKAIMKSLSAGVVPHIGLHHIQVGRKNELDALMSDLLLVEDSGTFFRMLIGRFGSGKSFLLNLFRTVALKRKIVVLQADITVDRRLYGKGGQALALYTELLNNMATRSNPDGNSALRGLLEQFVVETSKQVPTDADFDMIETVLKDRLKPLVDMTHGSNFIRAIAKYTQGFTQDNDDLMNQAILWIRGEYSTKTDSRRELAIPQIIEDSHLYDMLKLWACFVRIAGYKGLVISLDEMVVLSERLNNRVSRDKNYELILQILNDSLQGSVEGLGFCLAGTEDFLSDRRRGIFSYEALETRLADNPFAREGLVNMEGPVIRLQSLSKEEFYVLMSNIVKVSARGNENNRLLNNDEIQRFMTWCKNRIGAEYFLTPRDAIKQFVSLLQIIEQNPNTTFDELLNDNSSESAGRNEASDAGSASEDDFKGFTL